MSEPLDELRQARLDKLTKIRRLGLDPFPQLNFAERQRILAVKSTPVGQRVSAVGRLRSLRSHGGSTFFDLVDETGKIQVFLSQTDLGAQKYSQLELIDLGDFATVTGSLFETTAGELTIKADDYQLVTKSLRPLPSSFYGLKDIEERYRRRFLDLWVNPSVRETFVTRTLVIREIRRILDAEGFLEVETPVLQTLYGGATAKPFVTHHNALGFDLYLRVSNELYLKRLIVGGLEKVYEIGKDFRNEGIDREHNPEFTMCEFYWAYQTYEGLMDFTEKLISQVVKSVLGNYQISSQGQPVDFTPPWPRLNFREALLQSCGLDVDKEQSEAAVLAFVKDKRIDLDLAGVVGWAPLLDTLYKKLVRPRLTGPLFLTDHPYQMKPLAKRKVNDDSKAASFQLLVLGAEIVNAYDELNDPLEQRVRWEEEKKLAAQGLEEYQVLDEDYLRALEYGMPPTAGWGLGVDRLVAILTNSRTLKDVILFPTLRPEKVKSPEAGLNPERESSEHQKSPRKAAITTPDSRSRVLSDQPSGSISVDFQKLPLEPAGDFPKRTMVLEFIKENLKNRNLFRHVLAVEAAMRLLAQKFGGTGELWGVLGLIHDADWEETKSDPSRHTRVTLAWLEKAGYKDGPLVQALKSHNRKHTQLGELQSVMEWALECVDELTGFIVSVTLVRPEKKLSSVTVEHILKKWKEKSFAAAVDRSQIEQCQEKLGIKLPEFIDLTLRAMQAVAPELGL